MAKHAEIKNLSPWYWITSTVLMLSPTCTEGVPPLYWYSPPTEQPPQYWRYPPQYWSYPSTALKLSIHSTDVIPHMYWCYPHMYWCYSLHVLMLSPTVLNNLHSTEAIHHSTEAIPPRYWCYPPQYWCYPPYVMMLSLHVLMLSPACTDVIRHMYWCYPPQYWTTSTALKLSPTVLKLSPIVLIVSSDVLNNLHSTEPTLYGVINALHFLANRVSEPLVGSRMALLNLSLVS